MGSLLSQQHGDGPRGDGRDPFRPCAAHRHPCHERGNGSGRLERGSAARPPNGRGSLPIAFDEAPWTGVFRPPLSVIRRPVAKLGATAVELLIRKIEDNSYRSSKVVAGKLVARQSVVPPRVK
ncbi:substrate-binding domain-containing protein [Shinella zoogloeoides]